MASIMKLPPCISGRPAGDIPLARQITILGANGSGKTRFMQAMMNNYGEKAYPLNAVKAFIPSPVSQKPLPGSIDALFTDACTKSYALEPKATSEMDRLIFLILHDEVQYLLGYKADVMLNGSRKPLRSTKLDKLIRLWQKVFPGNQILREQGKLLFSTRAGEDTISMKHLSHGEKTVLYYILGVLYAPSNSVVFVDSPSLFLHPSILNSLWNAIEALRPDCKFVYNTHDLEFVNSRVENVCIWVKKYDVALKAWDYEICDSDKLSDDVFLVIMGSRKPVLFIEGDSSHSIDIKLYTLVFPDYTVRPLGGCNRVIESTRAFNDLKEMHHLDSHGIVDRDRRTDAEVDYLRKRSILVPNVAEVENLFISEDVIRVMARNRGRKPDLVFSKVSANVIRQFSHQYVEQALMHARHRVKRLVECKVDGRFGSVEEMENHIASLSVLIRPREIFETLRKEFRRYLDKRDYASILKVFNHKPLLSECGIHSALGYPSKKAFISGVLSVLQGGGPDAGDICKAFRNCFDINGE